MEALLFAVYGLVLLYPPIRFVRDGGSRMLSLRVAPLLLLPVPFFPFLPSLYELLAPGGAWPSGASWNVAEPFCWAVGAVCCGIFCVSAAVQYLSGRGEARKDKWAIVEGRALAAAAAGDYGAAVACYEDALRSDPRNHIGHFRFARLLRKLGYFSRARGHFLLALEHAPADEREALFEAARRELASSREGLREADAFVLECERKGLLEGERK